MKTKTLSLVLITIMMLSICGSVNVKAEDGTTSPISSTYQNSNVVKSIFMVYMCGDNNLASNADSDIQEMIAAGGSDSNVVIIILLDKPGTAEDGIYKILSTGPVKLWTPPGEINSADPATLLLFLNYVHSNFLADQYILDIWDHGNGYQVIQGVAYDDNPNTHMSIPALRSALTTSGMHFDLIAFDACLMDMIEVAYELRNNGDVLVASEENIPLNGYPYTPILNWLKMNPQEPAATLGSRMVAEYIISYKPTDDVTLAAIDLAKVPTLTTALNDLSNVVLPNMGTWQAKIKTAISNTERYPFSISNRDYGDIIDFTEKLDAQINDQQVHTATAAVRAAATSPVIAQAHQGNHVQNAHGLSVWLAWNRYYNDYTPLQFAEDTSWDEFSLALLTQTTALSPIAATPASPLIGKDFIMSGTLTTTNGGGVVGEIVQLQKWDGSSWNDVSGKIGMTGPGGAFTIITKEDVSGTYTYRAHYAGSDDIAHLYIGSDSPSIVVTVQKISTQLTVTSSNPTPLINTLFTITGTLTADGAGLSGKTVRLWTSTDSGATWTDTGKTTQTSAPNGKYILSITEATGGYRMYKVMFYGDNQYAEMESKWITVLINSPPDVSQAYAIQKCILATSKHSLVTESIMGVTDPDGNPITIRMTRITSDEVTATDKQSGGSKYAPDAGITADNKAIVRAERSNAGDGRVYAIGFTASDGLGGVTQGIVKICVPIKSTTPCSCVGCIDSGQLYDATGIN